LLRRKLMKIGYDIDREKIDDLTLKRC